jgi:hypothetical protein
MEGIGFGPTSSFLFPFLLATIVSENLEGWAPFFELHLPI